LSQKARAKATKTQDSEVANSIVQRKSEDTGFGEEDICGFGGKGKEGAFTSADRNCTRTVARPEGARKLPAEYKGPRRRGQTPRA